MAEKQVYGLQILTFLVNKYDYQIVNIKGLSTNDYWLVNMKEKYPLICITNDTYNEMNILQGTFGQIYRALMTTFVQLPQCLVINTSDLSTKFEFDKILQIPVIENQPLDDSLMEVFKGMDQAVRTVEDISKEKRNLKKILQQKARNKFYAQVKENNKRSRITLFLLALCIAIYFGIKLINPITQDEITSAIIAGAYYKMNVVSAYEYWRLLTAGFIHVDMWHLLMNMMSLINLGSIVERHISKAQYLLTLILSIIVGNLFVLIGDGNIVGVGISGGLFGLFGVYSVMLFAHGAFKNPRVLHSFISTLMMNLLISLLPNISMLAHVGGFITGIVMGICFFKTPLFVSLKKHVLIAFTIVLVACCARIPSIMHISPIYGGTDAKIIYTLQELHLDFYADYLMDRYSEHIEKQGEEGYREMLTELVNMERMSK